MTQKGGGRCAMGLEGVNWRCDGGGGKRRDGENDTHLRRLQRAGGSNTPAMVMCYANMDGIANEGVVV